MDNPNNRTLHPGRPYHPEPFNGPPTSSWVPPQHNHPPGPQPQAYLGQNHAPQPGAHHSPGRPSTSLDPYQIGFNGGPLLPNPVSHSYTLPNPNEGLYLPHQGHWASHPMQAPIPPNYGGMMNMSGGLRYELMPALPAVGSGYPPQPPGSNMGMGLNTNTGLDGTIPALPYYAIGPPPMYQAGPVGLDPQPAGSAANNRRLASRVARAQSSYSPSLPPVYHDYMGPHRRSNFSSRVRRSPLNTRPVAPSVSRDTEEDGGHISNEQQPAVVGHQTGQEPAVATENSPTRPLPKISSMEIVLHYSSSIKIEDLPEQDRECSICYNKYGVEAPEGIRETPRRLPKCRHVFGDYCLKKWLKQSASCPYCRDKLPLQFDHNLDSRRAQVYMSLMRARARISASAEPPGPPGPSGPLGSSQERHSRLVTPAMHEEEEVGEAQIVTLLEQQLHRSGETDFSAVDGESTPSDSSSAPASPNRTSLRDVSRFTQGSSRAARQRGGRRERGSRSSLPPLQPLQSDGPSQPSATIPGAVAGENESSQSPEDAGRGPAETPMAPATTAQIRNRPW